MNSFKPHKEEKRICPVCKDCEMKAGHIYNVKGVLNMWIPVEKFPLQFTILDSEKKKIKENEAIPLADHSFMWTIKSGSALRYKTYHCPKCNILLTDLSKPQEDVEPKQIKKISLY